MDEEKKEEPEADGFLFMVVFIGIIVLMVGVSVSTMTNAMYDYAIEKTQDEIYDLNVSDDYRQGWLDALDAFQYHLREGINVTANG